MKNYLFPLLCCLALASCKNDLEFPSLEMSEPASSNHLMEAEVIDQSQWVSGSGILIDEDIYTIEEVGEDIFLVKRSAENFQFEKKLLLFEDRGRADSIYVPSFCTIKDSSPNSLFLYFPVVIGSSPPSAIEIVLLVDKEELALLDSIHTRFQIKDIEILPPDTLLVLKSVLPQPKTALIEKYVRSGDTLALAGSKVLPNLLGHFLYQLTCAGESYLIQSSLGGIVYLSSYDSQFNETWIRNITEDSLSIFTLPISQQLGSPYLVAADSRRLLSFDLADGALRSQFLLPSHITLKQGVMRNDTLLICGYAEEETPNPNSNLAYGVVGMVPVIDGIFQAPVFHTFGSSDTFSSVQGIQVAGNKLICTGRTEAFFLPVSPIYQLDEGVASGDSRAWWFRVGGYRGLDLVKCRQGAARLKF